MDRTIEPETQQSPPATVRNWQSEAVTTAIDEAKAKRIEQLARTAQTDLDRLSLHGAKALTQEVLAQDARDADLSAEDRQAADFLAKNYDFVKGLGRGDNQYLNPPMRGIDQTDLAALATIAGGTQDSAKQAAGNIPYSRLELALGCGFLGFGGAAATGGAAQLFNLIYYADALGTSPVLGVVVPYVMPAVMAAGLGACYGLTVRDIKHHALDYYQQKQRQLGQLQVPGFVPRSAAIKTPDPHASK